MDCNKEEALKAKQMAEKKMENKDFSGALKIAVKGQLLYPELENISQLILVCEVHCSAEKSYGTDKDWYGILKVESSADDTSIKKQYRKLALALHPDKNKFSGSTDAFRLVGEAQRVLLDHEKRMIHDRKRKAAMNWYPRQPNVVQHPWNQNNFPQGHSVNVQFQNNFTGVRPGNSQFSQQRAQTGVSGNRPTFWTACPFCAVRYQFYRDEILNKNIHCQSCKKAFTAYEMNIQGPSQSHRPSSFRQQNNVPPSNPESGGVNSQGKEPPKAQGSVNRKKKKKMEESSESGSSSESEEGVNMHHQPSQEFGEPPRRSSRAKRNVSYKEIVIDIDNDDDDVPSHQAKKATSRERKVEDTFWKEEVVEESMDVDVEKTEPVVVECPDPQFSDFDKHRKEKSFVAGQTWAVYDTEDAMPRFYAYIRKVESPGFHLLITWLKPTIENEEEENWFNAELPISCGKFKRGKHDKATDLPMFSHKVFETLPEKGIFTIFPRKGEAWALFKNWSMNWYSSTEAEPRTFEYEFVEILSDYDDETGVCVCYLEKVKGFVCVYQKREGGVTLIPASDKYRLSHMVPSSRMTGEEREGVPKGSFELDPASLPSSAVEQVNL